MTTTTAAIFLAEDTLDAYMADEYGPDRWAANIQELIDEHYSPEAIDWIVRSKIARWANDANLTILEYIRRHVGDAQLRTWMNR